MTRILPFDPWRDFSNLTAARIALGRAGGSVPTRELLDFGLAHARARDAVRMPFDAEGLAASLQSLGQRAIVVESQVASRAEFLRRPDLGRRLSGESRHSLTEAATEWASCDLCIIISDGLSAQASQHAVAVICSLSSHMAAEGWRIAPVIIARFGRVALQDEIGELFGATLSLMLLGERPGLGSPDSLGAYFVYAPQVGKSDANRNCVSNIRPAGLPPETAVTTLYHLLRQSLHRKLSGIELKDERVLPMTAPRSDLRIV